VTRLDAAWGCFPGLTQFPTIRKTLIPNRLVRRVGLVVSALDSRPGQPGSNLDPARRPFRNILRYGVHSQVPPAYSAVHPSEFGELVPALAGG
jgi:hypothetical protein